MNSKELHGPECTCSQCTLGEEETIVDLTGSVAKDEVFALNEKVHQSCQKLFKIKEEMLERNNFCDSKLKVFVNKKESEIDFDLKEANCEQEINCVENPDGKLRYFLKANKFHSVWSLTFVVTLNYGADNTRFYYIGFGCVDIWILASCNIFFWLPFSDIFRFNKRSCSRII